MKKRYVTRKRILIVASLVIGGYFALFFSQQPPPVPGSVPILVPALTEASGLATSLRSPDLLWSHNDSKGEPVLYGFGRDGSPHGALRIQGVKNIDWEAISSFELEGKVWLAIGDVGDNSARRRSAVIYFIEEPPSNQLSPLRPTLVSVAWSVPYRYEDGPHDCETLMVDARLQELLLITKRGQASDIYRLPLRPNPAQSLSVAKKVGAIAHLPRPTLKQSLFPVPAGRFRSYVTDGAISPDGYSAAILTYGDVLIYSRESGETWTTAFQHSPQQLSPHGLQQGEAVCFSNDGKDLFVVGEQKRPLLLHYPVPNRSKK